MVQASNWVNCVAKHHSSILRSSDKMIAITKTDPQVPNIVTELTLPRLIK